MSKFARWQRRLKSRLAKKPQVLFLNGDGATVFADWCEAHPGEAVELIVSATALHELVCEPGLPLADEAALEAYARQLFGHYFGAAAQRWALAGWTAGEQRGATALHGLDWSALAQAAAANDVDLRRARPAWAPLLNRLAVEEPDWLRAGKAGLAWVEGNLLTWLRLSEGQVTSLRQLRLPVATTAALGETLAELRASEGVDTVLAVGYGLSSEGATPVLPGVRILGRLDAASAETDLFEASAQPASLPQPDFLGPRVQRSLLAWPLAATGALVLATAGWSAWDSKMQREQVQQVLSRMQQTRKPVAATAPKPVTAPLATTASKTAEAERLRAAREVQGLLQQAWEPLLANVEQAGAGRLNWLGLDYSAGRNELRLEGLVQDKLAALQLADRLAAAPGWGDVVLSRFSNAEQGLTGQRFELGAKLRPDLLKPELGNKDKKKQP